MLLQFLAPYRSAVPVRIESLSSTMRLDDDNGRIYLPQLLSNLKIIRARPRIYCTVGGQRVRAGIRVSVQRGAE